MSVRFFKCNHCGNVVEKIVDSGVPVICCGERMQELTVNTVDASVEKHMPVVTRVDDCHIKVEVGSVAHPMTEEHHIAFIYVETENGGYRKELHPESAPHVVFELGEDKAGAVYAYCNLHGLGMTKL